MGGTAHPVWFKNDPRVSNCRVLGGVLSRPVMEGVVQTTQMVKEKIKPLPPAEQEKALADIAATLQASMPPREIRASTPRSTRSTRPGRSVMRTA